jgi:4-hydroxy-2-oxoheptanedioate aldolase
MSYSDLKIILQELKDLGAVGIKTSFEDEGAEFNDVMVLRKMCNEEDLKLVIKIGGAEANTDINMCLKLDCDGIVAPMIESQYALKKYLDSTHQLNINSKKIERGINLETITAHNNFDDIIQDNAYDIDCLTIGRVDLVGSLKKDRSYINSNEIFNIVNRSFTLANKYNSNIKTYLGGSINIESFEFIKKLKHLINFIETRYIVFDINKLLNNYKICVEKANLFEYYWLNYISLSDKIIKNKKRIQLISKRVQIFNKNIVLYGYYENESSKKNLLYFLNHGIVENTDYFINCSNKSTIDFSLFKNKHKNLTIMNTESFNAWNSWKNILESININQYENFIFIKDKICGPYNVDNNWVDFITQHINDSKIILAGYGTSPMGKLFKFPYIPDKFMGMSIKTLNLLFDNNIFERFIYNANNVNHPDLVNINSNPENGVEIILSRLLLDNNISYVSLDKNGIHDLNILEHYKTNFEKLSDITESLHSINDTTIIDRIFWTGETMRRIFDLNDKNFIEQLKKKRLTNNIKKWM